MSKDKRITGQSIGAAESAADHRYPPAKSDTLMTRDATVPTEPSSPGIRAPVLKTLGRYRILKEVGRGGMGAVYLAEDDVLKRKVALKVPQFEPSMAEQMNARFIREAQMVARLSHPNICQVYDVGVVDGQLLMAMEYIDGRTLSALTKPGKLANERQVVALVRKIALALEVAHQLGMIHRDLKPGNIMLAKPDLASKVVEPKVMDFGLAKSLDTQQGQLTQTGMIVGTPCYMSKEQWSGKEGCLGPESDVFSLGVILYELLTGHLPYDHEQGEPPTAWFVKLVTKPQVALTHRNPQINPTLESIVMRAIAVEQKDRYASMAELAADLGSWLNAASKVEPTSKTQISAQQLAGPSVQSFVTPMPDDLVLLTPVLEPINSHAGYYQPESRPMGSRSKPPNIPLIAGGAGGALLLILIAIWIYIRNPQGEVVAKLQVLDGASVEVINQPNMEKTGSPTATPVVPTVPTPTTLPNLKPVTVPSNATTTPPQPPKSTPAINPFEPAINPFENGVGEANGNNLLKTIPANKIKLTGARKVGRLADGTLHLYNDAFANPNQAAIPVDIPAEYDLKVVAAREEGTSGVGIGIVVGGRACMVWVDTVQKEGGTTGISEVNRKGSINVNHGTLMTTGVPSTIIVRVRKYSVHVNVDGKEIFAWEGDPSQLNNRFNVRAVPGCISIAAWEAKLLVTHVELTPIESN